jgi:hypothetical protein
VYEMNRYRQRHPDHVNYVKPDSTDGELTVHDTAAQHRSRVIEKDKAARARKAKGTRRVG